MVGVWHARATKRGLEVLKWDWDGGQEGAEEGGRGRKSENEYEQVGTVGLCRPL